MKNIFCSVLFRLKVEYQVGAAGKEAVSNVQIKPSRYIVIMRIIENKRTAGVFIIVKKNVTVCEMHPVCERTSCFGQPFESYV